MTLAIVVAAMTMMSQAAFADNVLRCHEGAKINDLKNRGICLPDSKNTGTGSVKIEFYERGTGSSAGYVKVG